MPRRCMPFEAVLKFLGVEIGYPGLNAKARRSLRFRKRKVASSRTGRRNWEQIAHSLNPMLRGFANDYLK